MDTYFSHNYVAELLYNFGEIRFSSSGDTLLEVSVFLFGRPGISTMSH